MSVNLEVDVSGDLIASLTAALTRNADELKQQREQRWLARGALQRIFMASRQSTTANDVIDQPDALMAKTGYWWDIRRLTITGFTAGTVTVFRNSNGGEPMVPFASAGTSTFGKGEILLHPGDRLVVAGTGTTGTWQMWGEATAVESWYLPEYLT